MLGKIILLIIFGLCGGGLTACGYYAVLSSIGVINRFAQHTKSADQIHLYEWMLIGGAALGVNLYLFKPDIHIPLYFAAFCTMLMGVFIGCFLMALQEAVKGIPVFARRTRLKAGLAVIITAFAIGKGVGSILFFYLN